MDANNHQPNVFEEDFQIHLAHMTKVMEQYGLEAALRLAYLYGAGNVGGAMHDRLQEIQAALQAYSGVKTPVAKETVP